MLTESLVARARRRRGRRARRGVTVPLLAALVPPTLPIASAPNLDLRVFAFAAVLSALTGLGFGLIPALRVGGRTGFDALRDGRARRRPAAAAPHLLVAIEVAVSVRLLISSGLLIRAVWRVQAVDPGFVSAEVLTLTDRAAAAKV